jgi:hypothetical protein
MGKYILFFILLCIFNFGCQPLEKEEAPVHVSIPGTPVSMAPTEDFELAPEMGGFKHKTLTASMMVVEIPQKYELVLPEFGEKNLENQGAVLMNQEPLSAINGMMFQTSRISHGLNFRQWSLLMPAFGYTILVNGTYLEEDEERLSEKIKNTLLTLRLNQEAKPNVLAFSIKPIGLKFAKILEGPSVMYTKDGVWNGASIFDLSFFVGPSMLFDGNSLPGEEFAIGQLKNVCADCELAEQGVQQIEIDSLKGHEILAFVTDSLGNTKRLKYQAILYDKKTYYLMVGTSSKNTPEIVAQFKEMSRSFKRKQA